MQMHTFLPKLCLEHCILTKPNYNKFKKNLTTLYKQVVSSNRTVDLMKSLLMIFVNIVLQSETKIEMSVLF